MMKVWGRVLLLLVEGVRGALDHLGYRCDEDPRETLDYAYQRQLELQQALQRGLADVMTSQRRLGLVAQQLQASIERLEADGRLALQSQDEEAAREALARRATLRTELADLRAHERALKYEEAKMQEASRLLNSHVRQFRTHNEAAKAIYSSTQARARLVESVIGLNPGDDELRLALQRAEEEVATSQARANQLDGLTVSGAVGQLANSVNAFAHKLGTSTSEPEVAAELRRLKAELSDQVHPALD
jgi:phage shock protein A